MKHDAMDQSAFIEQEIGQIRERLFFCDDLPADAEIVVLVKRWRELEQQLHDIGGDVPEVTADDIARIKVEIVPELADLLDAEAETKGKRPK